MTLARLDRVPFAGVVSEPASPLGQIGAVLRMARSVAGVDQAKAAFGQQAECLGVVVHKGRLWRGSDDL